MAKATPPTKEQMLGMTRAEYALFKHPFLTTSKIHDLRKCPAFWMFFKHPCFICVIESSHQEIAALYTLGRGEFVHKRTYEIQSNSYFLMSLDQYARVDMAIDKFKFSQSSIHIINALELEYAVFAYLHKKLDLNFCTTSIYNPVVQSRDDGFVDVTYLSCLAYPCDFARH